MDSQNKTLQKQSQSGVPSDARVGDRDYRYSEEFRAECEARYVLAKPLAKRREYLLGVEKERGADGRSYLERVIRSEWEKRKPPSKGG